MALELVPVESRRQRAAFIDLPHRLYAGCAAYVPRLCVQQEWQFSAKNPWYAHGVEASWLARRDGREVGRVSWFLHGGHVAHAGRREAFFGFLDAADDAETVRALLGAVEARSRAEGCEAVLGPIEFSTNDTCGLLTDGFDLPPAVMMPWNPAWLPPLLEAAGYAPAMALEAWEIPSRPAVVDALAAPLRERLAARGITLRPIDFSRFDEEVAGLYPLYQRIFGENWGFMPLSRAEFEEQARDLRRVSIADLAVIAEDRGERIGYAVALFDANQVLASFRRGRLLPFNFLKLRRVPRVGRIRVLNLGVVPRYRRLGLDLLMYAHIADAGRRHGVTTAEASYVMGNNRPMRQALERMDAYVSKRYAIYRRGL
jgi:ribosomal protein S18 acetylase RimI-like enzyme